jgi:Periplasmic binding protein
MIGEPTASGEVDMTQTRGTLLASIVLGLLVGMNPAAAQKKYDSGATDNEIKIGNIMPYSGPLSAYALIGRTEAAFFKRLNEEGGINGRKINFITYDDAFSPPKTVEQARKLVESDEVLLVFNSLGTPTNNAIRQYMNQKKVPQLFVATGATQFGDSKSFQWTMGWQPTYQTEGRIYAKYILQNLPQGKIGILYQNDDSGRDYIKGLKDGLGAEATSDLQQSETMKVVAMSDDIRVKLDQITAQLNSLQQGAERRRRALLRIGLTLLGGAAVSFGLFVYSVVYHANKGRYGTVVLALFAVILFLVGIFIWLYARLAGAEQPG